MKKRMMLTMCVLASGAAMAVPVEFRDYDANTGTFTNAVRECTLVMTETRTLENGWYAVQGTVVIPAGTNLTVNGAAHLILCDGASLTATPVILQPGVSVNSGNALSIYGQTAGTGALTAHGGMNCAGIGGGGAQDGGTVTINGGTIEAQGGAGAAGIGGGRNFFFGGGGGGTITIHGGTVTAMGGLGESSYAGAGIGCGNGGVGGLVAIDGGAVAASGGGTGVDPIGNGYSGRDCQVELSGGLFSFAPKSEWILSGCEVVENTDEATRGNYRWKVEAWFPTVQIGTLSHVTAAWTSGDGSVTNVVEGTSFQVKGGTENVRVIFAPELAYDLVGDAVVNLGTVTADIVFGEESGYLVPQAVSNEAIVFRDYDANTGTFTNAARKCTFVTSATRTLENGWYAVQGTVAIPAGTNLTVSGTAHLILCDGASLTIPSPGDNNAAVRTTDAALIIYDQAAGTGALVATGGTAGAGIGGGYYGSGGTVTINGGVVTATGGEYGAGIGGGKDGSGHIVTINGGRVTATGGLEAASIGGGWRRSGGTVTISGGAVVATAGKQAAGIGGGYQGRGGTVMINGGVVTATGGEDGAGIGGGGGGSGSGDIVTITGGTVTATGGACAAGIGGGNQGSGGTVTINGGAVAAQGGGEGAADIGGGRFGSGGTVTIYDGIFKNEPQTGWLALHCVVFENSDETTKGKYPYAVRGIDVPYLNWDPVSTKMTNAVVRAIDWIEVTDATRTLENGKWYVVTNHVVFPDNANLTVNGSAHLILCDGASLTILNPGGKKAAVNVSGNASLVIYGQIAGTGALVATGGDRGAGIGGGTSLVAPGGTVTINGGRVTANGGYSGAGIGGGEDGAGGAVTINGGTVTATGGRYGASIGGGNQGSGGTVTINGGAINASNMRGSVQISGGIFARPIKGEWTAEGYAIGGNSDSATSEAYPYAVMSAAFTVTISDHPYSTVRWTYGNGAVTSLVTGTSFKLGTGMTDVRVIFTPEQGYRFHDRSETGVRTLPSPVVGDCYIVAPELDEVYGEVALVIGEGIKRAEYIFEGASYEISGEEWLMLQYGTSIELVVEVLPRYYPFAGERTFTVEQETMRVEIFARPIPKGMEGNPFQIGAEVFVVTNAAGVMTITGTGAMSNFVSAADVPWNPATVTAVTIAASVTQIGANAWSGMADSVAINGTALSTVRYLAPGVGSAEPAGAISPAEFEHIDIIDGKALLDVSVYTSDTLTNQNWSVATNAVIEVPAEGKQGFFILKSKPAK